MKTSRLLLAALTLVLLLLAVPRARALTVQEGFQITDFPNSAAAAVTYTLDVGGNDFVGASSGSDADYFKVTVLPGRKVTAIQTTGSASHALALPLYAGTYQFVVGSVLPGNEAWGFTFVVAAAEDYSVTTGGGQIVVTDRSGFGDTLTVSALGGSQIKFAAPGRTFSLNGAAFLTGDSGGIPYGLGGVITVNAGAGNDTIVVGALGSLFPSLTLNGGTGDDTVNFTGDITFVAFNSLNVDLQDDAASPGADSVNVAANVHLTTSEAGGITVRCSRSVSLGSGASLTTAYGALTVEANQQESATPGNFVGVNLSGATLRCSGFSLGGTALTVRGRGGNDAGGYQLGVNLDSGAIISGGERVNVAVTGTGGAGAGGVNRGVTLNGAGAKIESTSATAGSVNVTGTGGPATANFGIGVSLINGTIRATGSATVTVTGTGAGAPGSSVNQGVEIGGGEIYSDSGDILVRGTAGPGASAGLYMDGSQGIYTNGGGGNITIRADSLSFLGTAGIETPDLAGKVTIGQRNAFSGPIDLGGADPAVDKLSLSDAVLDRISTANLIIGVDSTTAIGTSAEVSPAGATLLTLYAAAVNPTFPGNDVTLDATRTLKVAGPLVIPITGPIANTAPGYPQLRVAGKVDLSLTPLNLNGTTFAGVAGNTFTLVENDGTDPIIGTFAGLPEGATFAWAGSASLNARITYTGGSGNDAVLELVNALVVTNTNNSGLGSLRDILAYAATLPGPNTITFHPSLAGATFSNVPYNVSDAGGVTVDASALAGGVTFDGSQDDQLFRNAAGSSLTLRRLTFTNGRGSGGGAIANEGTLALDQCTVHHNHATSSGGAIFNFGTLTLTGCTLHHNTSAIAAGAIDNLGTATLTRCTLAINSAFGGSGGAIFHDEEAGTLELTHCTLFANSCAGPSGGAIRSDNPLTLQYCLVAGHSGSAIASSSTLTDIESQITSSPGLLAPLGDYGGPTQTIVLLPGHPARNAATTSISTSDQRGFPIVGLRDIGAYEAGTITNYAAWKYETLPAAATLSQRDPGFDFDGDGRLNVLEYATFTDPLSGTTGGALPSVTRNAAGTQAGITFPVRFGATDLLYEIERSYPGVGPWVKIADANLRTLIYHAYVPGIGIEFPGGNQVTLLDNGIPGEPKVFYRLKASVP